MSKFKSKRRFNDHKRAVEVYIYNYVFSSFIFNDDFLSRVEQLIFRYNFVSSTFYRPEIEEHLEYIYSSWGRTNPIDGFYYMTAFPSGGCPNLLTKLDGEK